MPSADCLPCGKTVVARPSPGLECGSPVGLSISEDALANLCWRVCVRIVTRTAAVLGGLRASCSNYFLGKPVAVRGSEIGLRALAQVYRPIS